MHFLLAAAISCCSGAVGAALFLYPTTSLRAKRVDSNFSQLLDVDYSFNNTPNNHMRLWYHAKRFGYSVFGYSVRVIKQQSSTYIPQQQQQQQCGIDKHRPHMIYQVPWYSLPCLMEAGALQLEG